MVASSNEIHQAIVAELQAETTPADRFSFLFALESSRHCLPEHRNAVVISMIRQRAMIEAGTSESTKYDACVCNLTAVAKRIKVIA